MRTSAVVAFPADHGVRRRLACRALVGRDPLLRDADALHRHRVARRAEAVGPGHRQVVDSDTQHRIGQLPGCAGRFGGAEHPGARRTGRLGPLHGQLECLFERERRGRRQCRKHGDGQDGRARV